jgi:hypothetical protein
MPPTADLRPLPIRDDTFLGVCQAIEEDLGISGNLLRIALGAAVLLNPLAAIGGYTVLGLAVGLSRLIAPVPTVALTEAATDGSGGHSEPLALAA